MTLARYMLTFALVMVEAKCIDVDNKQATLSQADPTSQPKLNNEQWYAFVSLELRLPLSSRHILDNLYGQHTNTAIGKHL